MATLAQKIEQNGLNMNGGQPLAGMLVEQAAAFAAAGANQAGATAITSQTALVNSGSGGVSLPLASPGLEIAVINDTTSGLTVYAAPAGADTINDQSGATGVIQMAKSMVIYSAPALGQWFAEGLATGFAPSGVNIETTTAAAGLSAAGNGAASATALTNAINPFGIKAAPGQPSVLILTHEFEAGRMVEVHAAFRIFPSLAAAFDAHARLLATEPVYAPAMRERQDADAFARALQGRYATDPHYAGKLLALMHGPADLARYDLPPNGPAAPAAALGDAALRDAA